MSFSHLQKKGIRRRRRKRLLVSVVEYLGVLVFYHGLRALPFRVAFAVGGWCGRMCYYIARSRRRVGMTNLALAFPSKETTERRNILKATFTNLGRMAAEVCHMHDLTAKNISQYVVMEDPAAWSRAMARRADGGALVLTGHFGNWELLACAQAIYGHPVVILHRPFRNSLVNNFLYRLRQKCGNRVMEKNAAAREIVRTLQRHDIVVVPIDQNSSGRTGIFANFFSVPASTTSGLARLAAISGAPVIPAFLVREENSSRHRLIVLSEVAMVATGNRDADTLENTRKFNEIFQNMVERYPDHWIWIHKRWKRRPPGDLPIY